ncbi:Arylsulfotransferase-domain-containing protein [Xylariaceae sp. AK1471]|nr:Arylsulfotransferase-domain-containing protein [Xylariaceae sp. AK1471]
MYSFTSFYSLPTTIITILLSINYLFLFTLIPPVVADVPHYTHLQSYQDGALGEAPSQTFVSSPLQAPIYQVNNLNTSKIDDTPFIFITGKYDGIGPSIISSKDLSLIWADPQAQRAQAARTYTLYGQPVLGVFASDVVQIYNQYYDLIYRITPKGEFTSHDIDSHEALITPDNTIVMIIGKEVDANLTSIGRPGMEKVTNNWIQEVDPGSNEIKLEFDMRDYFDVNDSFWPWDGEGPYHFDWAHDLWHLNSVEKTPDGDFLISSRHLHSLFLIDGITAKVKWVLGGKRSNFTDVSSVVGAGEFHWQHNARLTASNRITLFDNHGIYNGFCKELEKNCSRGLEIEFDNVTMTYKMVNEWYHPQGLISASRGGVSRTPKGNTLIAWGQNPMYTEYTPDGEVVMDIQRGQVLPMDHGIEPVIAYRAWKADWWGRPKWPPSIAAKTTRGVISIYVSWNGATEVDSYVLFTSDNITDLNGKDSIAAMSSRTGFETSFQLQENMRYARIAALSRSGNILGYTKAVDTVTHGTLEPGYPIDNLKASKKQDEEDNLARARSRKISGQVVTFAAILLAVGLAM